MESIWIPLSKQIKKFNYIYKKSRIGKNPVEIMMQKRKIDLRSKNPIETQLAEFEKHTYSRVL